MEGEGVLYICPTPIGNMEDITLRVLKVLKEADIIAAEDTRRTVKILNHYNIKTPLTSYHRHNRRKKGDYLIKLLEQGKKIALVSDAGTPGISDPGFELIKECIDTGKEVIPLPGAVAAVTALVASGLSTDRFFFVGFLPKNSGQRKRRLEELKTQSGTIILYVSPHGIRDVLCDCLRVLGNRRAVIARELTKKYEEFIRSDLEQLVEWRKNNDIKGELILLLQGAARPRGEEDKPWYQMGIRQHLLWNMEKGYSKKEAITITARERGIPKKAVYAESIKENSR